MLSANPNANPDGFAIADSDIFIELGGEDRCLAYTHQANTNEILNSVAADLADENPQMIDIST